MSILDDASNIRTGDNPAYVLSDFVAMYPQFGAPTVGSPVVPTAVLNSFIALAHASIKEARWCDMWSIAMGYFVAHFATLWLQGFADVNSGANAILAAGQAKGLNVSESVGDVSVSTDYNAIAQDLDGWAMWKTTVYGQQLATFGKLVGKGGMYVY
jgi:hypothetical protein